MIQCYFNEEAYYIVGQDLEIFATLINPETDPIRRIYWAFLMIVPELSIVKDNVSFQNDSRLIDEMNGYVHTLDEWTREAKRIANSMLSSLNGIVLFRKIEKTQLDKKIDCGRTKMTDPLARQNLAAQMEESWNAKHNERVRKLRNHFFGEKNGG